MREYPEYLKYTTKETEEQAIEELMKYFKTREYIKIFHDQIFSGDKLTLDKIQEDLPWAINRIWQDLTEEESNK